MKFLFLSLLAATADARRLGVRDCYDPCSGGGYDEGQLVCQADNSDACWAFPYDQGACYAHTTKCKATVPKQEFNGHCICSNVFAYGEHVCSHDDPNNDKCLEPNDDGFCPPHTTGCNSQPPPSDKFEDKCVCSNGDFGFGSDVCQHDDPYNDSCYPPDEKHIGGYDFKYCPPHTTPCKSKEPPADRFWRWCKSPCVNAEKLYINKRDDVCLHDNPDDDSCYLPEVNHVGGKALKYCPPHTSPCKARPDFGNTFWGFCDSPCSNAVTEDITWFDKVCLHDNPDDDSCYLPEKNNDGFKFCPSHTTPCRARPDFGDNFHRICPSACSNADAEHIDKRDKVCFHDDPNNDSCFLPDKTNDGFKFCPPHTMPCRAVGPNHVPPPTNHCTDPCFNDSHSVDDPVCQADNSPACWDYDEFDGCPPHTKACVAIDTPDVTHDPCDVACAGTAAGVAGVPVCQSDNVATCWPLQSPCYGGTHACESVVDYDPIH